MWPWRKKDNLLEPFTCETRQPNVVPVDEKTQAIQYSHKRDAVEMQLSNGVLVVCTPGGGAIRGRVNQKACPMYQPPLPCANPCCVQSPCTNFHVPNPYHQSRICQLPRTNVIPTSKSSTTQKNASSVLVACSTASLVDTQTGENLHVWSA